MRGSSSHHISSGISAVHILFCPMHYLIHACCSSQFFTRLEHAITIYLEEKWHARHSYRRAQAVKPPICSAQPLIQFPPSLSSVIVRDVNCCWFVERDQWIQKSKRESWALECSSVGNRGVASAGTRYQGKSDKKMAVLRTENETLKSDITGSAVSLTTVLYFKLIWVKFHIKRTAGQYNWFKAEVALVPHDCLSISQRTSLMFTWQAVLTSNTPAWGALPWNTVLCVCLGLTWTSWYRADKPSLAISIRIRRMSPHIHYQCVRFFWPARFGEHSTPATCHSCPTNCTPT